MSNTVKKVRQTCTCKDCGNESEMVITCTLEDIHEHTEETPSSEPEKSKAPKQQVKGSGGWSSRLRDWRLAGMRAGS